MKHVTTDDVDRDNHTGQIVEDADLNNKRGAQ